MAIKQDITRQRSIRATVPYAALVRGLGDALHAARTRDGHAGPLTDGRSHASTVHETTGCICRAIREIDGRPHFDADALRAAVEARAHSWERGTE